jgi:LacI family transcriptional regulator
VNAFATGVSSACPPASHNTVSAPPPDGPAPEPEGAQDAALARGQILLIIDTGGSERVGDDAVDRYLEWRVDGLIFATEYHRPFRLPTAAAHLPTVLVNCFADRAAGESRAVPTILPDEVQGDEVATQALIQAGHRWIGFINGPVDYFPASSGRLTGYRRALESAGIPFDGDLVSTRRLVARDRDTAHRGPALPKGPTDRHLLRQRLDGHGRL